MAEQMFDLTGKRALVTGSTRGIGRAIALALASRGADVVVHGIGSEEAAVETVAAIERLGVKSGYHMADLRRAEAAGEVAARACDLLGGIDVLFANAAMERRMPWLEAGPEDVEALWAVNFGSTLFLAQALAPAMTERGWGRIVTLGSAQERRPNPQHLVYAATKCAQTSMVAVLARELGPHGVTVNNLAPGAIETDQNAAVLADPAYRAMAVARVPVGRLGTVADCAGAAVLLASEEGGYINGQTLFVDGGWSA